jgi:hypothetical protein
MRPSLYRELHDIPLHRDDVQMIRDTLDLASEMVGAGNNEVNAMSKGPRDSDHDDVEEEVDKEGKKSPYSINPCSRSGSEDDR